MGHDAAGELDDQGGVAILLRAVLGDEVVADLFSENGDVGRDAAQERVPPIEDDGHALH